MMLWYYLICFLALAYLAAFLYEKISGKNFTCRDFAIIYMVFVGIIDMAFCGVVGILFRHPEYAVNSSVFTVEFMAKYLLLSFFAAVLLPVVRAVYYKRPLLALRASYQKYQKNLVHMNFNRKQRAELSVIVNFFFIFTMIIFIPYDIFFANQPDFQFGFSDFWWITASFGLITFFLLFIISMILPLKWFWGMQSVVFAFTLCAYIQRMFLNLYVTSIVDEQLDTGAHPVWSVLNLAVWGCIIVGMLVLLLIKTDTWKNALMIGSMGLIAVQGVALITLLFTENLSNADRFNTTTEGLYELSPEDNIIVFLLDHYDIADVDLVLKEDPNFYDDLEGFTYFDNAAAVYSRSYPSNTYLLTGLELPEYHTAPYSDCVEKAFSESSFLPTLKQLGFEIELYTLGWIVGDAGGQQASNYSHVEYKLPYFKTVRSMLKCSLYFDMPYAVKPYLGIDGAETSIAEDNIYSEDDAQLYRGLIETGLSTEKSNPSFKFIHLNGAHSPYTINEQCESVPGGVKAIQQFKGCMNIVKEYLDQMKELGVYESSTIIITADHGNMNGRGELNKAVAPILFIKPAYAGFDPLKTSHAQVSHADLFPTIIEAAGGDYDVYGIPIFDIPEGESRTRIFHYTDLIDWAEREVIDYKIPDDIRDFDNWEKVSSKKVYESLYKVAK